MSELLSPEDLARELGLPSAAKAVELTREKDWPHVRFTNKLIRYTAEHVEQIIAAHTVTPDAKPEQRPAGTVSPLRLAQTQRSRSRTGA